MDVDQGVVGDRDVVVDRLSRLRKSRGVIQDHEEEQEQHWEHDGWINLFKQLKEMVRIRQGYYLTIPVSYYIEEKDFLLLAQSPQLYLRICVLPLTSTDGVARICFSNSNTVTRNQSHISSVVPLF